MALMDLLDWLEEHSRADRIWYVKRLSANDTLANKSHQAGPYIPKDFLFSIFPAIATTETKNPDTWFDLYIDSHTDHRRVRAIYYNNKFHENPKGGRNEARLTNFGGSSSALLDPDNTGSIAVFVFALDNVGSATHCHVWVCDNETEGDLVEDRLGPIEPGRWTVWSPEHALKPDLFAAVSAPISSCRLSASEIPGAWLEKFPTGMEIIEKAVSMRPDHQLDVDRRLMRRRDCEFEIFQSLEEAVELPFITKGFGNIDEFIARAQTILQRRKSRSGRSLELHARKIFIEEKFRDGLDFVHQPRLQGESPPDFIFPSVEAYQNTSFPVDHLRVLAVKTTCKDRWRQVTKEARRIPTKHLLTLQEGVSENQFIEMNEAGVRLVVPKKLHDSYPKSVRPHLTTFESFIGDVRLILESEER